MIVRSGIIPNILDIKRFAKQRNEVCLSNIYINARTKLKFKCQNNHLYLILWSHYRKGHGCAECAGNKKKTIEEVISYAKTRNYECLNKKYINAMYKLKFKCDLGHIFEMSWSKFNNRQQSCPVCHNISRFGAGNPSWCGGSSRKGYCDLWLDKEYKELILRRDNYECQNPVCYHNSKNIFLHHIDYNKKNCSQENLITLCNSCNSRANFNRNKWYEFYTMIINNK
jgi:hypothetical protein